MKKVSGFNIPVLFALSLCLVAPFAKGQDFQRKISWQDKPKTFYTIDEKQITQPTFTKANHSDQLGLLPVYNEIIPVTMAGSISVQLVNPVYSPAGNIDNNSKKYIKAAIEPKAELSIHKKAPGAFVSFLPFRKNPITGTIEKLESFSLRLTVIPRIQSRSLPTYASNSVLASGSWYKIAVSTEGIFKLDYTFIKTTMGIDPGSFSLSNLAVFGNGGGMVPDQNSVARPDDLMENPIMVVDNNGNNQLDQDDFVLFYGQMPDAWTYNSATQTFGHIKNLYTDKTFYFLTTDRQSAKRVPLVASSGTADVTVTDFDERAYHESDEVSLLQSGKRWLGDRITRFDGSKSISFTFPNLITSTPVRISSAVAVNSPSQSVTSIKINNTFIGADTIPGIDPNIQYGPASYTGYLNRSYTASSNQLTIDYSFLPGSDPQGTAAAYIDYFDLNLKRALTMSGDAMPFRSIASIGAGNVSNFILSNATSSTHIWDITSISNIQEMQGTLSGSQLSFTTPTDKLKEFIAFNANGTFTHPEFVSKIDNQDLHSIGQASFIIITYDDFVAASNDLADFHRTKDNMSVNVVKLSQVYNEFSSGKPDISAIRDFVRMLYVRANSDTSKMPRYLLLMGDGSFDPKGRVANSNNFISTYQSYESDSPTETYTSDDFFGLLDSTEGGDITNSSQLLDIGVGRIPVESETEASDVVAKIKNYKYPKPGAGCVQTSLNNSWRNILTFVADDEDGDIHIDASDGLAVQTQGLWPKYNYDKIYLDAYKQVSTPAGDRYPDVNTAILNRINSGTLLMNWVGHGGPTNWAHERIFNMPDIVALQNQEKLPLFITATCDFSAYDLVDRTAGESLIVNGKGGAIASITTVRLVYSNANAALNQAAFDHLFTPYAGRDPKLGEVAMLAKNDAVSSGANSRKFTLLGDPALQLNYPRNDVVTTIINNVRIELPHDTLKALSNVTIKGEVRDNNGVKLTWFNGVIYPEVFDKISDVATLGNDADSPIRHFKLYKNIIFKGKASVTNGDFSFSFIVPKDINYQYGASRISYYADNGNYIDAHGYSDNIVIGGSADSAAVDNTGPKMKVYMNDEKFVFGGMTDASPVLYVKLEDESGINTVGNGVGHDLTAILDDDNQNKVVLNDYYESDQDNFRKGSVKYPLSKLTDGRHSVRVKAWDIYNNSTEEYTEFIVTSNAKLALNHVYNYPNPFTTHTEFMFEHNRPCDNMNISIQIYTVSGKLVKSISQQQVQCPGYRVDNISWDGLDDYGDPIGKGVYVYKLTVRASNGDQANKFEKLVVLR